MTEILALGNSAGILLLIPQEQAFHFTGLQTTFKIDLERTLTKGAGKQSVI